MRATLSELNPADEKSRLAVRNLTGRFSRLQRRVVKDESGVTAIEFGMVGLPFFMMMFGIMGVGLHFFAVFSLENAVEQASRPIRTGQAQQAGMTKQQFKDRVCSFAPAFMDCTTSMRVNVVETSLNATPTIPSCVDAGGSLLPPAATSYSQAPASVNVVVTVCFEWDLPSKLPFFKLGNMPNGKSLLQAATSFKTEPYQ
jgi:Flp pilus assembly protein TadG